MDKNKTFIINHPAYIISGSKNSIKEYAIDLCLNEFCNFNGCKHCIRCNQILNKQFYAIHWLTTEKQYNVSDIETIFEITALENNQGEKYIFVIESADRLNEHASNKLLKILEEPPTGYHFLLLTTNPTQILPTIRSRCIEKQFAVQYANYDHEIIKIFTNKLATPNEFLNFINKLEINELDTKEFLEAIFIYWSNELKNNSADKSLKILSLINEAFDQLPMAGGSKIFWKNFYLKFCMIR